MGVLQVYNKNILDFFNKFMKNEIYITDGIIIYHDTIFDTFQQNFMNHVDFIQFVYYNM